MEKRTIEAHAPVQLPADHVFHGGVVECAGRVFTRASLRWCGSSRLSSHARQRVFVSARRCIFTVESMILLALDSCIEQRTQGACVG